MKSQLEVIGVHPIDAHDPCHLIEIVVAGPNDEFDWGQVSQEVPEQPQGNWQVAYDEQLVETMEERSRYTFFFHYLDPSRPLRTSFGEIELHAPTPVPAHLSEIDYDPPC